MSSLPALFLRLATTAPELSEPVQQRIHRFAVLKKHEEIAAALARRPDTVEAIDAELASWSSAKVQAAWFARPGRSAEQAASRVAREKRVTVLEVVAALEGLPDSVYERCAARGSVRVSIPLLTNDTVPESIRAQAASVIGADFANLSYAKRHSMGSVLSTCPSPVASAFIASTRTVEAMDELLKMVGGVDYAASEHVLRMCEQAISTVASRRRAMIDAAKRSNSRYISLYDLVRELAATAGALSALSATSQVDEADYSSVIEAAEQAKTAITNDPEHRHEDAQLVHHLDAVRTACASVGAAIGSDVDIARSSQSPEVLLALVAKSTDRAVAVAVLCNRHATAEVANEAMAKLGYYEPHRILEARSKDMSLEAKAAVLYRSYQFTDETIRSVAAPHEPADLWAELVRQSTDRGLGAGALLSSAYATAAVVPTLPLKLFTDESVPAWAVTSLLEYLEEHLTSQAAWDGFEVLAPKHLGDVATVVRAASRTARPSST